VVQGGSANGFDSNNPAKKSGTFSNGGVGSPPQAITNVRFCGQSSTGHGETLLYYTGSSAPVPTKSNSTTLYYADDAAIGLTTLSYNGGAPTTLTTTATSGVTGLKPLDAIGGSISTTKNQRVITFTTPVAGTYVLTVNDTDGDMHTHSWTVS